MPAEINQIQRKFAKSIFLSSIFALILIFLSYRLTNYYAETQFLKISEQKSLSELDLYHDGIRKLTQQRIEHKIDLVEKTSQSPDLYQALLTNNLKQTDSLLNQVLGFKSSFDMMLVLDDKGKLITIVGLPPQRQSQIIYGNYANREYFQHTFKSKKTYISKIFLAYGDYYVITVSTPIFDQKGNVKYILTGSDKLENIVEDFNFKTRFANLFSILVDQEGNLVVKDSQPLKEKINILAKDSFVRSFIHSYEERFNLEVNFNRNLSYVRGSVIDLGNNNKFYLFSYLPYFEFRKELSSLKLGVQQLYLMIFVFSVVVFVFGWLMFSGIIKDLIKKLKR